MSKTIYNKLVRDFIPAEIILHGVTPKFRRVKDIDEFKAYLRRKMVEETYEFSSADTREKTLEELADILTTLHTICEVFGISIDEITQEANKKTMRKGGFTQGYILESVEDHIVEPCTPLS